MSIPGPCVCDWDCQPLAPTIYCSRVRRERVQYEWKITGILLAQCFDYKGKKIWYFEIFSQIWRQVSKRDFPRKQNIEKFKQYFAIADCCFDLNSLLTTITKNECTLTFVSSQLGVENHQECQGGPQCNL